MGTIKINGVKLGLETDDTPNLSEEIELEDDRIVNDVEAAIYCKLLEIYLLQNEDKSLDIVYRRNGSVSLEISDADFDEEGNEEDE